MSGTVLVDRYAGGGPLLAYAVWGLTPAQSQARTPPGEWSISELVCHLLDTDLVYADRVKRIIAEDRPTLQAFEENLWITRLDSRLMPVDEAATLFAAHRQWMTRILRARTEADFARQGIHSSSGPQSLAQQVASSVSHVDHHLRFLYAKRGNLGVAIQPRYAAASSS